MDQDHAFVVETVPDAPGLFVLRGELDMATVPVLTAAVDAPGQGSFRDVTLDLRGLTFIDSTGISALIKISAGLGGGSLTLLAPPPNVARVLHLVRADAFPNVQVVSEG